MKRYLFIFFLGLITSAYSSDLEILYKRYKETENELYYREFMKRVKKIFGKKEIQGFKDDMSHIRFLMEKYRETGDNRYYKKFMSFFHKRLEIKGRKKYVYKGEDRNLLKLILKTFLATNDLENGFTAAEKGTELFPDDIFFLKNLADISIWLGKYNKAVEAYYKLYVKTKKKEYREKALKLSMTVYRYDIALKILKDEIQTGNYTHWKEIVAVYESLGEPEKAKHILKLVYSLKKNREALKKLIYLNIDTGNIDSAVKEISRLDQITVSDALEFSRVFYALRMDKKSLDILKRVIGKADFKDYEYWSTLSDLAWGLKDYETGFFASSVLYYTRKSRKIDYERMILFTINKDKYKELADISYSGWLKYRSAHFFYYYLYALDNLKDYDKILLSIRYLPLKELNILKRKEFFWFYYIKAILNKEGKRKAVEIYRKAVSYMPNSDDLITGYIWLLIDLKLYDELEKALNRWKHISFSTDDLILAYASGYSLLQNSLNALPYIRKLYEKNNRNPEIVSLYADILEVSGDTERARYYRYKAWRILKNRSAGLNRQEFKTYLYLSIFFEPADRILYLFKKAEKIMDPEDLKEIKIIYNLQRNNYQTVKYILKKYRNPSPWIELNLALKHYDRYRMDKIIKTHKRYLPIRDSVEALKILGYIGVSKNYGFENLNKNPYDNLLYRKYRDIVQNYENRFNIGVEYYLRRKISQFGGLSNFKYKSGKYSYHVGIKHYNILSNYNEEIKNLPSSMYLISIGISSKRDSYSYGFSVSYLERLKSLLGLKLDIETYLKDDLHIRLTGGKNLISEETMYLYYGGMKDILRSIIFYNLTNNTFLDISAELNRYKSQDNKDIGKGYIFTMEGFKKLRIGYPDYTFYSYLKKGYFSEKEDKGIINRISIYNNPVVLPESYLEIGTGFSFGLEHKNIYTRIWRPYFNSVLFANSITGLGFGFEAGAGGSLWNQDHLSLGLSFFKGVQGTTDSILKLNIGYFLLF